MCSSAQLWGGFLIAEISGGRGTSLGDVQVNVQLGVFFREFSGKGVSQGKCLGVMTSKVPLAVYGSYDLYHPG